MIFKISNFVKVLFCYRHVVVRAASGDGSISLYDPSFPFHTIHRFLLLSGHLIGVALSVYGCGRVKYTLIT